MYIPRVLTEQANWLPLDVVLIISSPETKLHLCLQ